MLAGLCLASEVSARPQQQRTAAKLRVTPSETELASGGETTIITGLSTIITASEILWLMPNSLTLSRLRGFDKRCLQNLYVMDPYLDEEWIESTEGGLLLGMHYWILRHPGVMASGSGQVTALDQGRSGERQDYASLWHHPGARADERSTSGACVLLLPYR